MESSQKERAARLMESGLRRAEMSLKKVVTALRKHGLYESRAIPLSKAAYHKERSDHFCVYNAQLFWCYGRILRSVNLDLTEDAEKLTAVARSVGENLYVLHEGSPFRWWKPGSAPMAMVLRDGIWWTSIRPEDEDRFMPMDSNREQGERLVCTVGTWNSRPAYSLDLWTNPQWGGCNTSGAVIQLFGRPPAGLVQAEEKEVFTGDMATGRGRPIRPLFYHQSNLLEYVWYSHGAAVPAVLYDYSIRLLRRPVTFTVHGGHEAIHVHQGGEPIGLVWPCDINAPRVRHAAQRHMREYFQRENILRSLSRRKKTP
jgi:hypothetical protein